MTMNYVEYFILISVTIVVMIENLDPGLNNFYILKLHQKQKIRLHCINSKTKI